MAGTGTASAPPGNVVSIPRSPGVDLDQDGLDDNNEDPNSNGLVDPGETDPDNDNTDGDRTNDGAEVTTGTDPLDPGSFFRLLRFDIDDTERVTLEWPSAPGAFYQVERSLNLANWDVVEDDIPADADASTTVFDAGLAPPGRAFYRARVR